jgi:hypothetical protein
MTRIDQRKTRLTFETSDCVRERSKLREVIFEVENGYIIQIRLKGLRRKYAVSPSGIYNLAVKIAVEKARAERKAKKRNTSK